jgi:hypothetical protein
MLPGQSAKTNSNHFPDGTNIRIDKSLILVVGLPGLDQERDRYERSTLSEN